MVSPGQASLRLSPEQFAQIAAEHSYVLTKYGNLTSIDVNETLPADEVSVVRGAGDPDYMAVTPSTVQGDDLIFTPGSLGGSGSHFELATERMMPTTSSSGTVTPAYVAAGRSQTLPPAIPASFNSRFELHMKQKLAAAARKADPCGMFSPDSKQGEAEAAARRERLQIGKT
eukprot:Gregarina_sp_Poly_1__9447@NODE_592_length_7334_cov_17_757259_g457_i0_p4_GENE_NODE_592_length_7334_cov_17_757259_g457_i0NODE_592_length_7334_cov_17_757259_g457_i0_p4_ORF_typecomplete_len172_score27_54HicB/PF05534_12/78HicB/PF05534_12/22HicB/PF05534_12/2_5e03_NODE_592_length_7334_cov_17_757259_g457_i059676482